MRELTGHKVNPANDKLTIQSHDKPGAGGANHLYAVYGFHTLNNPSADSTCRDETCLKILFQNGPIGEAGVNGITQEVLLAIVVDRLQAFQAGPYACEENGNALEHIEAAQRWLLERTKNRMARGVEGTHTV
jgi:hypothetical protein